MKLLAIVGPTASGKSECAVALAKKFNGEIVSCDSRQIYTGMDLGTGKVAGKWKKSNVPGVGGKVYVYKSVPHYCIDYVNPKQTYSAALFQADAQKAIVAIAGRGKLPILCGGSGQWTEAVAYNIKLPEVKPDSKLRKRLEKLTNEQLLEKLKLLDPDRAAVIDWHNKRRLIRSLEIVLATGKPLAKLERGPHARVLWLGLYPGQEILYKKIDQRLKQRLRTGMVNEVKRLNAKRLSWKRLENFGLEYKYISLFLQKKLTQAELLEQLSFAIKHYAKRQMTWFRKNEHIQWFDKPSNLEAVVQEFLKQH